MRAFGTTVVLLLSAGVAACAGNPRAGHVRFHNRPPVETVNDRRDVRKPPAELKFYRYLNRFDSYVHKRLTRWMEMPPIARAANVNSIDEVPNSTWFTNRIGVRDLTIAEIERGPTATGSPQEHVPWMVKSSKVGGTAVGFIVEDKRGVEYILKFDTPEHPEAESATDVVAQRLLWAIGYNVPEDHIVFFKREDLVLSKDAVVKDAMGGKKPMTDEFVDAELAKIHIEKDGTIRGLVSQYLDGKPLGGHPPDGVREDDRNDRVPHQRRRELRGGYAVFSWLDHTDMFVDNALDMWVTDPADRKVHYVMHYLVDFGKALGVQALSNGNRAQGRAYSFDLHDMSLSLVALGLWKRPWEGRTWPEDLRGVGIFESRTFDAGKWKPASPNYFPLLDADRFDGFWGAKIIIRFTPAQIRAAVAQGRYSDPRAAEYVTRTLIERQRKLARYWFDRVAPLDRFTVELDARGQQLCFEDLALRYRLAETGPQETRYAAQAFDASGRRTGWRAGAVGGTAGRACLRPLAAAPGPEGYTIVRIDTARGDLGLPAVLVHLARDPASGRLRLIGLRRL